jgi:hypothetical protein
MFKYGMGFKYSEALNPGRRGTGGSLIGSWLVGIACVGFMATFMSCRLFRWMMKKVLPASGEGPSEK